MRPERAPVRANLAPLAGRDERAREVARAVDARADRAIEGRPEVRARDVRDMVLEVVERGAHALVINAQRLGDALRRGRGLAVGLHPVQDLRHRRHRVLRDEGELRGEVRLRVARDGDVGHVLDAGGGDAEHLLHGEAREAGAVLLAVEALLRDRRDDAVLSDERRGRVRVDRVDAEDETGHGVAEAPWAARAAEARVIGPNRSSYKRCDAGNVHSRPEASRETAASGGAFPRVRLSCDRGASRRRTLRPLPHRGPDRRGRYGRGLSGRGPEASAAHRAQDRRTGPRSRIAGDLPRRGATPARGPGGGGARSPERRLHLRRRRGRPVGVHRDGAHRGAEASAPTSVTTPCRSKAAYAGWPTSPARSERRTIAASSTGT